MLNLVKFGLGVVLLAVMTAGSASASCSNSNLSGPYGFIVRGVFDSSQSPVATSGMFAADGAGNISSGNITQSLAGAITTGTLTGTYNIAKNCTGTVTTTDSNSNVRHYAVVVSGIHKGGLTIVETDSGLTASGNAHMQGVGICGLTGKAQTFAENLEGFVGGVREDVIGRLGIDGSGNIAFGVDTFDVGGTSQPQGPISGTYTANSNCTGTAQIVAGHNTYNFSYVTVDAGNQYLMIETDANTTVAGSLIRE